MRSGMSWQHQLETDTSLLRKQTGFSEPVSFREGLRRTIAWERENSAAADKTGRIRLCCRGQSTSHIERPGHSKATLLHVILTSPFPPRNPAVGFGVQQAGIALKQF